LAVLTPGQSICSVRIRMRAAALFLLLGASALAAGEGLLPGTRPLETTNDLSREMVAGIDRFLMREIASSVTQRTNLWHRDFSSTDAYEKSVRPNRDSLRRIIGAVDERVPIHAVADLATTETPSLVAEPDIDTVHMVRWPVFSDVHGEGLLVQPKAK